MIHTTTVRVLITLIAVCFLPALGAAEQLPERVLIPDVPFVSWRDAARWQYPDSGIVNPSTAASTDMVLRYRGGDFLRSFDTQEREKWENECQKGATLVDLKRRVAGGDPAAVWLPLTPIGHPVYPLWSSSLAIWDKKLLGEVDEQQQRVTGALLPFASFDLIKKIQQVMKQNGTDPWSFWDSVLMSVRVMIGYDDGRNVIILHDPSFGPAIELPTPDFQRMWEMMGQTYCVSRPKDKVEKETAKKAPATYPKSTPDQDGSRRFVFAYANAAAGNLKQAEEEYRSLSMDSGMPANIRHLALMEMAHLRFISGQRKEAAALAEEAIKFEADDPRSYDLLAAAYQEGGATDAKKKAQDAKTRLGAICQDKNRRARMVDRLRPNVLLFGLFAACR